MQMKVLEESLGAEVLLSKGFWLDYSNAPRGIYSRFKLEVSVTMMALLLANKKNYSFHFEVIQGVQAKNL